MVPLSDVIAADGTHSLVWEGFPIPVSGVVDFFFKFFQEKMILFGKKCCFYGIIKFFYALRGKII